MDLDNQLIIKLNMLLFYIIRFRILFYFFPYIMEKFKILDIIILNEIYQLNNMIIAIDFKKIFEIS